MEVSYYPGCSHHGTALEYTESTKAVSQILDVDLKELPDWGCCGATSAHILDEQLATSLAVRNISIARREEMDLIVPCAACYNRFKAAQYSLKRANPSDPNSAQPVRSLLDLFDSSDLRESILASVRVRLDGLKVVCYYGCLLVRPPDATGAQDYEFPESMDRIMALLGAEALGWSHKTDCCGASMTLTKKDITSKLVNDLLNRAMAAGAEAVVVACPFCHLNLDARQREFHKDTDSYKELPIFYFTELMGICFGAKDSRRWLRRHFVDPLPLLASKGLIQGEG
jgi:heterodisulfide reductase subunit B2